jgi:cytochrome c oxidase subunit 2
MIQASTNAVGVDNLFYAFVIVCSLVLAAIIATLFYLCIKYREGAQIDRSSPPVSNIWLELSWTLPSLIIFIVFFIWGAKLYIDSRVINSVDYEVFVIAKQWIWKFQHPDGRREVNELHIPIGKKIKLTMISEDVIHSLFIPDFRIKQDILPLRYTTLAVEATNKGVYPIYCTQYCGMNHARMLAKVFVMSNSEFKKWTDLSPTRINIVKEAESGISNEGKKLFNSHGCNSCHSVQQNISDQNNMSGPSLWNLHGQLVTLQDGSKIKADDNYIHESVFKPNAKIVKNYGPIMPTFIGLLNEEEFQKILSYIKSLKQGSGNK